MDIKLIFTGFCFLIVLPTFANEQQKGVELCQTLITALNSGLDQNPSSERKQAIENAIKYVQDLKEQISKTKNINIDKSIMTTLNTTEYEVQIKNTDKIDEVNVQEPIYVDTIELIKEMSSAYKKQGRLVEK